MALGATSHSTAPSAKTLGRIAPKVSCPDGYYCQPGAAAPIACPAGSHSNSSIRMMTSVDECVTCGAGTYCPVGSIKPVDCAPGTFNPNVSQALCRRCSAGTYQDKEGALECKTCDPGRAPDPDLTSTELMCSQSPQLYPQLKPQLAPKQSVDPSVNPVSHLRLLLRGGCPSGCSLSWRNGTPVPSTFVTAATVCLL